MFGIFKIKSELYCIWNACSSSLLIHMHRENGWIWEAEFDFFFFRVWFLRGCQYVSGSGSVIPSRPVLSNQVTTQGLWNTCIYFQEYLAYFFPFISSSLNLSCSSRRPTSESQEKLCRKINAEIPSCFYTNKSKRNIQLLYFLLGNKVENRLQHCYVTNLLIISVTEQR